jgi:hypothetical protein
MIQSKDWVMLFAIFGAMGVSILWPQTGAPFRPYLMICMMMLLFLRFLSFRTAKRISKNHYSLSLALCIFIILGVVSRYADFFHDKPSVILEAVLVSVALAVVSFSVGTLASLRQPLQDRLSIIISFGIINNILVVVFSSEFFGPIEPLVAMVYIVPFFCSIIFLRAYAMKLKK